MKIDKTVAASVALHALVIGWGMVSFSTKAFESMPEDSVPVDIISADQFAKAMSGMKTGKKENPKPLVEKIAAWRRETYRATTLGETAAAAADEPEALTDLQQEVLAVAKRLRRAGLQPGEP